MKNKGLIAIIIILLLGLCGSVGYIVYDKIILQDGTVQKEEKSEGKKGNVSNVEQLEEKNVITFMRRINSLNAYFYKQYPIKDSLKLDNAAVLELGESLIIGDLSTYGGIAGFSGDRMRDVIASYLGSDYPLKLDDINCFLGDGVWLHYDSSKDYYSRVGEHGHGGPGSGQSKAYFQDGTYDEDTDTYTLHVKVLSSPGGTELGGPRTIFFDAFNFDKPVYNPEGDVDYDIEYDAVYKEISDQLSIVTYTFVKNSDGGYGLKSVSM